ncbi:unnamed protein product [Vitrella brassicaformis CCMP3155]|uniref:C2HC/C3H-type domain-containing protein n=1 Tax=Vitrella brassicaformis (strain CCMP3155) TaxID=1169540 RepID=A0A0G4EU40_VITBC|nr:unnamed protein product [Vitrella brassicaformis CCMP3155]|eukprot:CEM02158.1 unnamed protein product [Vitrella brassicaformis CCMP3155]
MYQARDHRPKTVWQPPTLPPAGALALNVHRRGSSAQQGEKEATHSRPPLPIAHVFPSAPYLSHHPAPPRPHIHSRGSPLHMRTADYSGSGSARHRVRSTERPVYAKQSTFPQAHGQPVSVQQHSGAFLSPLGPLSPRPAAIMGNNQHHQVVCRPLPPFPLYHTHITTAVTAKPPPLPTPVPFPLSSQRPPIGAREIDHARSAGEIGRSQLPREQERKISWRGMWEEEHRHIQSQSQRGGSGGDDVSVRSHATAGGAVGGGSAVLAAARVDESGRGNGGDGNGEGDEGAAEGEADEDDYEGEEDEYYEGEDNGGQEGGHEGDGNADDDGDGGDDDDEDGGGEDDYGEEEWEEEEEEEEQEEQEGEEAAEGEGEGEFIEGEYEYGDYGEEEYGEEGLEEQEEEPYEEEEEEEVIVPVGHTEEEREEEEEQEQQQEGEAFPQTQEEEEPHRQLGEEPPPPHTQPITPQEQAAPPPPPLEPPKQSIAPPKRQPSAARKQEHKPAAGVAGGAGDAGGVVPPSLVSVAVPMIATEPSMPSISAAQMAKSDDSSGAGDQRLVAFNRLLASGVSPMSALDIVHSLTSTNVQQQHQQPAVAAQAAAAAAQVPALPSLRDLLSSYASIGIAAASAVQSQRDAPPVYQPPAYDEYESEEQAVPPITVAQQVSHTRPPPSPFPPPMYADRFRSPPPRLLSASPSYQLPTYAPLPQRRTRGFLTQREGRESARDVRSITTEERVSPLLTERRIRDTPLLTARRREPVPLPVPPPIVLDTKMGTLEGEVERETLGDGGVERQRSMQLTEAAEDTDRELDRRRPATARGDFSSPAREIYHPPPEPSIYEEREEHEDAHAEEEGAEEDEQELPSSSHSVRGVTMMDLPPPSGVPVSHVPLSSAVPPLSLQQIIAPPPAVSARPLVHPYVSGGLSSSVLSVSNHGGQSPLASHRPSIVLSQQIQRALSKRDSDQSARGGSSSLLLSQQQQQQQQQAAMEAAPPQTEEEPRGGVCEEEDRPSTVPSVPSRPLIDLDNMPVGVKSHTQDEWWRDESGGPQEAEQRVPCMYCGRRFLSSRLAKHESICGKHHEKEESGVGVHPHRGPSPPRMQRYLQSKKTHYNLPTGTPDRLRRPPSRLPSPRLQDRSIDPLRLYDTYETCPYCKRQFAPQVIAAHEELCATVRKYEQRDARDILPSPRLDLKHIAAKVPSHNAPIPSPPPRKPPQHPSPPDRKHTSERESREADRRTSTASASSARRTSASLTRREKETPACGRAGSAPSGRASVDRGGGGQPAPSSSPSLQLQAEDDHMPSPSPPPVPHQQEGEGGREGEDAEQEVISLADPPSPSQSPSRKAPPLSRPPRERRRGGGAAGRGNAAAAAGAAAAAAATAAPHTQRRTRRESEQSAASSSSVVLRGGAGRGGRGAVPRAGGSSGGGGVTRRGR